MALGQYHCGMESKPPQDTESRHADKYIVRFPDGMRDRLKEEAKANNRTLNAEIVARLQQSFDAPPPSASVSHSRTMASPHDLAVLYDITEAQMRLQQATMTLGDAKDEAFRISVVMERRERELREAEEAGQDDAFLSVRKDAYHKVQKEFKAAQQAVMAAKNDVHAKQAALSELHMRRATETNIPDPRNPQTMTASVETKFGDAIRPPKTPSL